MIKKIVTTCVIAIMICSLASCSTEDSRDPEIVLDENFRIFYLNTQEHVLVQSDGEGDFDALIDKLYAYQKVEGGMFSQRYETGLKRKYGGL